MTTKYGTETIGPKQAAHAFHAAADTDLAFAQLDRIRRAHDGLQARAAQAIHIHRAR